MPVRLIHDGYSVTHAFEPCDDYEEFSITYRPATEAEYTRYTHKIAQLVERKAPPPNVIDPVAKVTGTFMSEHLIEWNILDGDEVAEISAENCSRLPNYVASQILGKIITSARDGLLNEQLGNLQPG